MQWINAIVQGVLVGGLYALFAAGLSLIFGVMRLVNIAHGDLIVLAAFLALVVMQTLGLGALESLVVVIPLMALLGYVLQRGLLNLTLGSDILPPLLVTFGLSVIIQNALLMGYSADPQKLQAGPIETASVSLGPITLGVMRLVNIAHGDLIVLSAYVALTTSVGLGLNPLLALVIVVPVMAAFGYALQRLILIMREARSRGWLTVRRVLDRDDVGVHPEMARNLCRMAGHFASLSPLTEMLAEPLETTAKTFDRILKTGRA